MANICCFNMRLYLAEMQGPLPDEAYEEISVMLC